MTAKVCGDCSMCCKLLAIPELEKPAQQWCRHAVTGKGCGIWGTHPATCQAFRCGWLDNANLDDRWKPSRSGLILRLHEPSRQMMVDVDPGRPAAWRAAPFHAQIKAWSRMIDGPAKLHTVVYVDRRAWAIFPEEDIDVGVLRPGERPRMSYRQVGAMRQPVVELAGREGADRFIVGALSAGPLRRA